MFIPVYSENTQSGALAMIGENELVKWK